MRNGGDTGKKRVILLSLLCVKEKQPLCLEALGVQLQMEVKSWQVLTKSSWLAT